MADYVIQHPGRPLTIPQSGGGGGGGYTTIEDNTGAALPQRTTLQFGAGLNASDVAGVTVGVIDTGHTNTWTVVQNFNAGLDTSGAQALPIGAANATSVTITPVTIWGGTKKLAALGGNAGTGFEYDSTGNGVSFLSAVTANVGQFAGTTEWNLLAGVVTQFKSAVGTGQTVGYSLRNNTASANNAPQDSAILEMAGSGWDASGLASYPLAMGWQLQSIQNALAVPTGRLALMFNRNNAGYSATPLAYFSDDSNGRLVFPSATRALPAYIQGSTGTSSAMLLGLSYISLNTDSGQVLLLDTTSTGKEIQPKFSIAPTTNTLKNGNATNLWLETWSSSVKTNLVDGNTADLTLQRSGNDGIAVFQNAIRLYVTGGVAGGQGIQVNPTSFGLLTDNFSTNATTTARWKGTFSYWYDTKLGAQLTAAGTITPTSGLHHVTGATTIDTIAVTNVQGNALLILVADTNPITYSAAGNIALAGTIALNSMRMFVWDSNATKWYPALAA